MVNFFSTTDRMSMTPTGNPQAILLLLACVMFYIAMRLWIRSQRQKLYFLSMKTKNWIAEKYQHSTSTVAKKIQTQVIKREEKKKEKENEKDLEDLI